MVDIIEGAQEEQIDVLSDSTVEREIIDVLSGTVEVLAKEEKEDDCILQISSL